MQLEKLRKNQKIIDRVLIGLNARLTEEGRDEHSVQRLTSRLDKAIASRWQVVNRIDELQGVLADETSTNSDTIPCINDDKGRVGTIEREIGGDSKWLIEKDEVRMLRAEAEKWAQQLNAAQRSLTTARNDHVRVVFNDVKRLLDKRDQALKRVQEVEAALLRSGASEMDIGRSDEVQLLLDEEEIYGAAAEAIYLRDSAAGCRRQHQRAVIDGHDNRPATFVKTAEQLKADSMVNAQSAQVPSLLLDLLSGRPFEQYYNRVEEKEAKDDRKRQGENQNNHGIKKSFDSEPGVESMSYEQKRQLSTDVDNLPVLENEAEADAEKKEELEKKKIQEQDVNKLSEKSANKDEIDMNGHSGPCPIKDETVTVPKVCCQLNAVLERMTIAGSDPRQGNIHAELPILVNRASFSIPHLTISHVLIGRLYKAVDAFETKVTSRTGRTLFNAYVEFYKSVLEYTNNAKNSAYLDRIELASQAWQRYMGRLETEERGPIFEMDQICRTRSYCLEDTRLENERKERDHGHVQIRVDELSDSNQLQTKHNNETQIYSVMESVNDDNDLTVISESTVSLVPESGKSPEKRNCLSPESQQYLEQYCLPSSVRRRKLKKFLLHCKRQADMRLSTKRSAEILTIDLLESDYGDNCCDVIFDGFKKGKFAENANINDTNVDESTEPCCSKSLRPPVEVRNEVTNEVINEVMNEVINAVEILGDVKHDAFL